LRLIVRDLSKAYGFSWALKDLTLDLTAGDLIALLGSNGAGKTTVLKLLAGLAHATSGEIVFDGKPGLRGQGGERSIVGFLTPGEHLYDNLTARENLKFFTALYDRNCSASEIDSALSDVGLASRANEYVAALSSGMKCRLSIAKWKLLDPVLMLLDEPYGVLDASGVELLENFLCDHCAKGRIVIIASHHLERVLAICSRAIVLNQGKMICDQRRQQSWESFKTAVNDCLRMDPNGGIDKQREGKNGRQGPAPSLLV
jgi:heme exporter protein A